MAEQMRNLKIEDARLAFKNFAGKEGTFNAEGNRNFCVLLDSDIAKQLEKDGWNIKYLKPRDEGEPEQAYMKVTVKYGNRPPKVVLVGSRGKTMLDEESINSLDWADLETVDLLINPYNWNVNGKTGITAYLKSLYAVIVEDELEKKYLDVPDSAENTIGGCGNCDICTGECHED